MKRKHETTSARLVVVVVAAAIVNISFGVHASPVPGGNDHHLVHSLATFATTNSFLYTNKIGSLNYRFAKPQLSPLQRYVKFGGFPQYEEVVISSPETPTSSSASSVVTTSGTENNAASTGEIKSVSLNNISRILTPPALDTPSSTSTEIDSDIKNLSKNNALLEVKRLLQVPPSEPALGIDENEQTFSISGEKLEPLEVDSSFDHSSSAGDNDFTLPTAANNKSTGGDGRVDEPNSNLENLLRRVINAPFREANSAGNLNSDLAHVNVNNSPIQNRQDSNFEQPITFFQPGIRQLSPQPTLLNGQQHANLHLPSSGTGNHRFSLPSPSTAQQEQPATPGIFHGNNRFAIPYNNIVPQRPAQLQPTQPQFPQLQQSALPSAPQLPQPSFPSNVNGFPVPSIQGGAPNQQRIPIPLSSPLQPQFQYPGGPPPPQQEPENGYNPFHLQENFPESPYESEFANDPPLTSADYEESVEQGQRSAGTNNAPQSPAAAPLDFSQSTLRNVKTEELLEVVQRKQVPRECVYNTISYGPNGEDCVEARKK